MKLYLDENLPLALAGQLTRRGFDVVSAREVKMLGRSDEEHLEYASQNDRALLTFDVGFIPLAVRRLSEDMHRNGIVITREINGEQIGELVRLCSRLLSHVGPGETSDRVLYLQQFRQGT